MVRLKDIAARAGVDISTVSRALGGDPEINDKTRDSIQKLADEMGYSRKIRQTRSGRIPGLVGVIVPEVVSGYYSAMLSHLDAALREHGKTPVVGVTGFDPEPARIYITGLAKAGAEGLLYIMDAFEAPLKAKTRKALQECGIPTAFITGSDQPRLEFDSVYVDELSGTRMAVEHLIRLGHKAIGYIGEDRTPGRGEAFRAVLGEYGLPLPPAFFRVGGERLEQGGYLRMRELLGGGERPTAAFVAYDQMAVGAMRALDEAGVSVPSELSLVSFDNIGASEYVLGGLTTVATPMGDTAALAVRLLLERIDETLPGRAVQHITIEPSLLVRSSAASL